jgi:hypothetical protein
MAYFQRNRNTEEGPEDYRYQTDEYGRDDFEPEEPEEYDYDDGFDELLDTGTEEETDEEEENPEDKRNRFRFAMGAGNLVSVIIGTLVFLVLLLLLLSMYNFVMTDMTRNLALFETRL